LRQICEREILCRKWTCMLKLFPQHFACPSISNHWIERYMQDEHVDLELQTMDHCHHMCDSIKRTWFANPMNMRKFVRLTIIMFHAMICMSVSCKKLVYKSCKTYSFNDLTILQYFVCKLKTHGPTLISHNQSTQTLITWDFSNACKRCKELANIDLQ
jgi:hypothetical protein